MSTGSNNQLRELIDCYLEVAQNCCRLLRNKIPKEYSFLRAKVLGIIPREGNINGMEYGFHGVGISMEFVDGTAIEIDFGPNDRCDGFDLHRLKFFFDHMKDKSRFTSLNDEHEFKMQFESLITDKVIHNPQWHPSPHLYYLF